MHVGEKGGKSLATLVCIFSAGSLMEAARG